MVALYRKTDWDALKTTCINIDSVMYSTACDLSINDYLWSSFREKLTSSIKRFIPHLCDRVFDHTPNCTPSMYATHFNYNCWYR